MDRVLVTGAAGFIGSHLVERLLEGGHEVIGVDCFTDYYPEGTKRSNLARAEGHDSFRLVEGDILNLDLEGLLGGVDRTVHLAGEPGVRGSWGSRFPTYVERNVMSTCRLLEAASRAGLEHFVYASSSSVYGPDRGRPAREDDVCRPASPYGLTKLAAEELVETYRRERGIPATVLRYFTVYGPRQRPEMALARFISLAYRGEDVEVFGDGGQRRELTYVSDAVEATVASLEATPGGVYNVGGGSRATVDELVGLVGKALGEEVGVVYGREFAGDVRSTWSDSGRAEMELGYRPRTSLEEGVRAQVSSAVGYPAPLSPV